jgi:hypothetical protein
MLILAVLLLSCGNQSTLEKAKNSNSLDSDSAAIINDKKISQSLDAIDLKIYYRKAKFSSDFDSLFQKKLFLGHVYISDIIRINNGFSIKGASDQILAKYIFDLTCDSTNARFIRLNPTISLEFYSNKIQKLLKDTVAPLQNDIFPVYQISGTIIKAIKPLP